MAEKKLTDEEIAKAILQSIEYSKTLTYFDEWGNCKAVFVTDILNLIHRLQSENAELQKQVDKCFMEVGKMCKETEKDTAREILREIGTMNLLKKGQRFGDLTDEELKALKPFTERMLKKIKELAERYGVEVTK